MRKTGHYQKLGDTSYFIPDPLPPKDPPFELTNDMTALYGETMLQLGKLNEIANRLPDVTRFIKAYVMKEALLSSAIEGVHTTILNVFTQPLLASKPDKDTQLVMNYTKAMATALSMIHQHNLPLSSRVILAAHAALMELGAGDKADPGHYRKQAVKVGNLIPAPAPQIPKLMTDLEQYINIDETLPPLIKAGLAHVQFETIHPFLDGNGRIGRLLIVLMLMKDGPLALPSLYPSYYFKKHQLDYYKYLDRVRTEGDFEGWIKFYLTAIRDSTIDAYRRAVDIEELEKELIALITKQRITNDSQHRALSVIFRYPVISIKELSTQLDVSYNTANKIISDFLTLGILSKETQPKRGKLFKFKRYLEILEQEYL